MNQIEMHFVTYPVMMGLQFFTAIHLLLACVAILFAAVKWRMLRWRMLSFVLTALFIPMLGPMWVLRALARRPTCG